jgi:hypothetical protein
MTTIRFARQLQRPGSIRDFVNDAARSASGVDGLAIGGEREAQERIRQGKLGTVHHTDRGPRTGIQNQNAAVGCDRERHGKIQRERGHRGEQKKNDFHPENLCAMGIRRPTPNALVVTFNPGAACWRLYSLRSTLLTISCTRARSRFMLAAISLGVR